MGSGHGGWLSDTFCNGFYGSRQVKLLTTRDCIKKMRLVQKYCIDEKITNLVQFLRNFVNMTRP